MNAPPRITVITPTYNRASFLPETIESILDQGYPNLEYLLLDDGSSDDTLEVGGRYAPHVQVLHHPNRGEAATVNRGWEAASGDFVCVVSSDDPQGSHLLRRSVEAMEMHPEVIVTYPDWEMIDDASRPIQTVRVPEYSYETMLRTMRCLPGPGTFIRRAAVAPHIAALRDVRYPLLSDFECWLRLGLLGPFLHIPEVLGAWRQHGGAVTQQRWKTREMAEQHLQMVWDFFANPALPPVVRRLERESKGRILEVAASMVWDREPIRAVVYLGRSASYTSASSLFGWSRRQYGNLLQCVRPFVPAPARALYRGGRSVIRACLKRSV